MLEFFIWAMVLIWGGQSILLLFLFMNQLLKENLGRINPIEPEIVIEPEPVDTDDGTTTGKVTTVLHGDTIQIEIDGEQRVVHLADIDCPASEQDDRPFGEEAKQFTSVHCLDQNVQIVPAGRQDDRSTAYVLLPNGQYLHHELVRHGLAWHVRKDKESKQELKALEDEAKEKQVGIWSKRTDDPGRFACWQRFEQGYLPLMLNPAQ